MKSEGEFITFIEIVVVSGMSLTYNMNNSGPKKDATLGMGVYLTSH